MAYQTPVLTKSFPCDTAIPANTVLVASVANVGNLSLPAAAGATNIVGVSVFPSTGSITFYTGVTVEGIVQCRFLTGVAIPMGSSVKIADAFGRVTKAIPGAPGTTLRGLIGIAVQTRLAGDATDTLIDVLLTPGTVVE